MEINKKTIIIIGVTLIAGMALGALFFGGGTEPANPDEHAGHDHEMTAGALYTCSMHPQVRQAEPGSCPFCGMELIPVQDDSDNDPAILKMSNEAVQLANIQTTVITTGNMNAILRLNGKVKADERRVNTQTTHFGGRIEKLYKDFVGESVRKGEKIATLYSPQLLAAQEELIEAKKLESSNPVLLEAARKKLRYWKLTAEQIKQIEDSKAPMRNFDLLADFDGVITKKMVKTGDHLHEGGALLEVADLSQLWLIFEVYEQDLDKIKSGETLYFTTPSSDREYQARVSFISPEVDPNTRVVEVRADFNNTQGLLKPDMFVKAALEIASNGQLTVPKSAVLWTGKRSIVYVKSGDQPQFELREVSLGKQLGNSYQILDGLQPGEEVVTNGAFTIDAEAQLQGKISMMNPAAKTDNPETTEFKEVELPNAVNYQNEIAPAFTNQLRSLADSYLALKDLMVEGNASDIRKAGISVKDDLSKVDMTLAKGEAHMHWMALQQPMQESLEAITQSGNRDDQRLQFINLSKALINALQSFGSGMESPLYIQFCPMANNDKGATWISREEEIINPYFGELMLNCGNVEDIILNK